MYIQNYVGELDALLDAVFASPKLNPRRNPTIEDAMRVTGDTVKKTAIEGLTKEIYVDLMDAVVMYEINNGEYEELEGDENRSVRDDYESGMDDAVENSLEPYADQLSADWLGKNTIDTELWLSTDSDRSRVEAMAKSAAKEVFKSLAAERTPTQVLANAGVTPRAVQERLDTHLQGGTKVPENTEALEAVIVKAHAHVGKGFDQLAVYEDAEIIFEEDDDILLSSAAERIGLDMGDVEVLQLAALDMDDAPSEFVEALASYKPPSAASKKRAQKAAKEEAAKEDEANGVASVVFSSLKECGAGDTAMAEALGVSRSTYVNYVKGKTHLVPDQDQYAFLRNEVVQRANAMLAALAALDGGEADVLV